MPTNQNNQLSNQRVTKETAARTSDHPADGAVHPGHGTIGAPIVVVGATGTIGRRIVGRLVDVGHAVIAVAPDHGRLESLRAAHPEGAVTSWTRRVLTEQDAHELAIALRACDRPIAGVVVAIAVRARRGRLLDRDARELHTCLDETLLPQLAIARHLVPLLAESGRNGRYVMIGRPGSESPWSGYGHHSIATAAVRMLAHTLHEEARALGVRVHLLSIDSPVRSENPAAHECPEWPTATGIARRAVELIDRAASEPATAIVTCGRKSSTDVSAFLKSLKTQHRHEVSRDDTP